MNSPFFQLLPYSLFRPSSHSPDRDPAVVQAVRPCLLTADPWVLSGVTSCGRNGTGAGLPPHFFSFPVLILTAPYLCANALHFPPEVSDSLDHVARYHILNL
jgi:hypothetical protein